MSDSASLDLPTDAGESTPGQTILPFQVPRLAMLTRPTQWVLCCCRASARASQPDLTVFILRSARLTRSTQWVLGSRRASATVLATHLMFRPSDGRRGPAISRCGSRPPAEHRPTISSILTPFPPAWRGLPVRCPESRSPIGVCESQTSSGFSLLPTRRRGYPSDIVVLISCQTLTLVSRWAPMLVAHKWGSSIRCRESWSPVGCRESLLVGRPKLFLSASR